MSPLDEPVQLVPHDPRWLELAASEADRLRRALGAVAVGVEHIGSTAVPGLIAKPIIDLMVGLSRYPPAPDLLAAPRELGYEALGEAGVAGRTYLRLRGATSFNAHLVQYLGTHWKTNLALRHHLTHSASARQRYAAAKTKALSGEADTLLAYSAAKAAAMQELVLESLRSNGDA